jgi:phosphoglycerate dehydrogenase-like enzyme
MQRVVFHYQASRELRRRLGGLLDQDLDVIPIEPADHAGMRAELVGMNILWHALEPVTGAMIRAAPNLRLIQKIGVGVNTIDLDAARAQGVAVCNMPGTNSRAVAEMTLALMLAALRRLPQIDRLTRAGRGWMLPADDQALYGEINGRTVGFVGYGAVPSLLAPVLRAMGATILYTNRNRRPEAEGEQVLLATLLARSDIVSLHVPLTPETTALIGARELEQMRHGAVLVNTARGGLVDEPALIRALRSGHLRAAALDTFAEEPLPPTHPLLALDNVVLAPHIAWLTPETLDRSLAIAIENCRRLVAGEALLHRVV